MSYWWEGDPAERFWVEIRKVPGTGTELRCPVSDQRGRHNPWYDLIDAVRPGDVVFHWHATQSRFVGHSVVAEPVNVREAERHVPLAGFEDADRTVTLDTVRSLEIQLTEMRNRLAATYPNSNLYLPFQMRSDGFRMMSNYFAKFPREAVVLFFGEEAAQLRSVESGGAPTARFLEPFRPKADTSYMAFIGERAERRNRTHETLVNAFVAWLSAQDFEPGRNRAIDVGLSNPPVIVEAKVIVSEHWALAIRQAIGQLYEYRFFQVVPPDARLIFLSSRPVPDRWVGTGSGYWCRVA